jgi:hypothetical protein
MIGDGTPSSPELNSINFEAPSLSKPVADLSRPDAELTLSFRTRSNDFS